MHASHCIGWRAPQADNRSRWLVHNLLIFFGRVYGNLFLTVVPILPWLKFCIMVGIRTWLSKVSTYRVLSSACTELLSPGAPPLHSLNKAQLRKIFLSFPDSRVKIVVYLRPKENIKQELTRSSGKYKYLLGLRFVVSAARARDKTVSLGRNEKSYFKIGSTVASRESYE